MGEFLAAQGILGDASRERRRRMLDLIEATLVVATPGRPFRSPEEAIAWWRTHCGETHLAAEAYADLAHALPELFPAAPDAP